MEKEKSFAYISASLLGKRPKWSNSCLENAPFIVQPCAESLQRKINHAAGKVSASSMLFPNMLRASLVTQVIRAYSVPKEQLLIFHCLNLLLSL